MSSSKSKYRLEWLDLCKGVAILMVVLTHVGMIPGISVFQTIQLPLFALISSYFIPEVVSKDYILKKISRLLLPYFLVGIISLLFWIIFLQNFSVFSDISVSFYDGTKTLILGLPLVFNGPLWYLPTIFLSYLFYSLINLMHQPNWKVGLFLIFFGSYLVSGNFVYLKYMSIDIAVLFAGYQLLGKKFFGFDPKPYLFAKNYKFISYLSLFVLFILLMLINKKNDPAIDLYGRNLGNPFLYTVTSLLGSFLVIRTTKQLENLRIMSIFSNLGKRSFEVLIYHWPALLFMNALIWEYTTIKNYALFPLLTSLALPRDYSIFGLAIRLGLVIFYMTTSIMISVLYANVFAKFKLAKLL